jgi:hypothetical protein
MSFRVTERVLRSDSSVHPALIIAPARPMVFGRDRLDALRLEPGLNDVDRRLIREVALRGGRVHVAIFRGLDVQGQRGWSFDESLSEEELSELGYLLTKALLPVHRRMMANGIALLVHSEWGDRECLAMKHGVRTMSERMAAQATRSSPIVRADQWILRNMLFHFALPLDHIVESVLPAHLRLIERRRPRLEELVCQLPRSAID